MQVHNNNHVEPTALVKAGQRTETAFGCPRNCLGNQFVYAVISPRARGLSIGINMNPGKYCNFDCVYCEVKRWGGGIEQPLNLDVMSNELQKTLNLVRSREIQELAFFKATPRELLELRHVALSGDGEPTLCPNFTKAVQSVAHVRALSFSFFKMVLITNATGLHLPEVQNGLKYFTNDDEIWAKLDAGTEEYFRKVNQTDVPFKKILANILFEARQRPVIIQSLFPSIEGQGPPQPEIVQYAQRLKELKDEGARIHMVQIHSATRPTPHSECGHLPLRTLSRIAETVRQASGLKVEVF